MSSIVIETPFLFVKKYHETYEMLNKELLGLVDLNRYTDNAHIFELGDSFTTEDGPAFLLIVVVGETCIVRSPNYLKGKQMEIFRQLVGLSVPQDRIVVTNDRDYKAITDLGDKVQVKKFS